MDFIGRAKSLENISGASEMELLKNEKQNCRPRSIRSESKKKEENKKSPFLPDGLFLFVKISPLF